MAGVFKPLRKANFPLSYRQAYYFQVSNAVTGFKLVYQRGRSYRGRTYIVPVNWRHSFTAAARRLSI
jgi:hypothetical protein